MLAPVTPFAWDVHVATETTHPSLLERVRDPADAMAWRLFDARYGPLVLGYCRARGLQLCDAEDVRQSVMLSLARSLGSFRYDAARGRFRDYLARVVKNAIHRHGRRHTAAPPTLSTGELEALARAPAEDRDAEWERQWAQHHCRLALASLRRAESPQNLAVLERLLAGRAAVEISAEFGLAADAVRKIKQRLRERLARLVRAQLDDEEQSHAAPR